MNNISIITAFFDIGRGNWTPDKGLPDYLYRPTETYFERFGYLAQLDNEMVIYTSPNLADKVWQYRNDKKDRTTVVVLDPKFEFSEMRKQIAEIQRNPNFQQKIDPLQSVNPEYWHPDYVLITNLKARFVNVAIKNNLITNDMAAWIDFGYCRHVNAIPASRKWEYYFNPERIHMFNYKDYRFEKSIENVITSNDVYILGAKVVAHKKLWTDLDELMQLSYETFQKKNLVDDDQGLWLMSYITQLH